MSAFATQLAAIIEQDFAGNQARFSQIANVYGSTVSRLVREEVVPSGDTIASFAAGLPRATAAALCGAFLRDLIPLSLRDDVAVWISAERLSPMPRTPPDYDLLDPQTRKSISLLTKLALSNREARSAINSTATFLGGGESVSLTPNDAASEKADAIVRRRIARRKPAAEP